MGVRIDVQANEYCISCGMKHPEALAIRPGFGVYRLCVPCASLLAADIQATCEKIALLRAGKPDAAARVKTERVK